MDQHENRERRPALAGWSFLASAGLHGLAALILVLVALFGLSPLPEEPAIRVTLLEDGPGAAGAAGGAQGGGGTETAAASAPAATSETPELPPVETAAAADPPQRRASAPALQATPTPPPPHHKPQPPRRHLAAARRPTGASVVPQTPEVARAPGPSPEIAAAGAGSGPGGPAGTGEGAEGTGAGSMGNDDGPGDDYLEHVQRWIKRFQYYPEQADKQGQRGVVLLDIDITRDGTVLDVRIVRSSGYPLLDIAAVQAVRNSSPVPPFPRQYQRERGTIEVPATYSQGLFRRLFGPG